MSSKEQLTVELPSELVDVLRSAVKSGAYASEGDMLTALLGWGGAEYETPEELEALRAAVAEGIADADAGRVVDMDEVHDELDARFKVMIAERER
jgi:antitoxin ParD1/3/4